MAVITGMGILSGVMNVFSLRRMETTKSLVHHKSSSRGRRKFLGSAPITDWTEQSASRFGYGIMFLAVCVWVCIGWSFFGLIPSVFLPVGIGGFIVTNLVLLVGEMVIQREVPERKKILGILWLPVITGILVAGMMWFLS